MEFNKVKTLLKTLKFSGNRNKRERGNFLFSVFIFQTINNIFSLPHIHKCNSY